MSLEEVTPIKLSHKTAESAFDQRLRFGAIEAHPIHRTASVVITVEE